MNLTTLKAQAEAARADSVELELWRESIEPDEFLRLVEVARQASFVVGGLTAKAPIGVLRHAIRILGAKLEGIEP